MIDVVPALAEIGPKWIGEGFAQSARVVAGKDPALAAAWEASGLPAISSGKFTHMETGARAVKGAYERTMLSLVQSADIATKMASYLGARAKFLSEHPGDLWGANLYGLNVTQRAQPLFLRSTTPQILRNPVGRTLFQFTQPALKVGSQQMRILGDTVKDPKQLALYLGAVSALVGGGAAVGLPMYRQFAPVVVEKGKLKPGYAKAGTTGVGTVALGLAASGAPGDIPKRLVTEGAKETVSLPIPRPLTNIATATGMEGTTWGKVLGARKQPQTTLGKVRVLLGFPPNEKPRAPTSPF
jgi:hypothetical protein